MALDQGISVECGMDNGVPSLVTSSHLCLLARTVSFSIALPLHTHHTFLWYGKNFTFRRMVDVRRKLLSVEVQDDYGDYNVILQSTWVRSSDTLLKWSTRFRCWCGEL